MDNSTTSASFQRSYPYIKTYWTDQSGHARYSLTSYHATILTAFLAILLVYALGRLLFTATFILHFFLYRHSGSERRKTVLDDQVTVIYANTQSPSSLLMYLLHLFKRRPYQAAHSRDWLLTFLLGSVFFVSQVVTVIWPGIILRSDPIPYSPGTCGYPRRMNTTSAPWNMFRYEQALLRYRECVDNGDHVSCPGPVGQTFSWEVFESEPGYCWFGQQYCYDESTTITERATITPNDMGTLRKSPMSLTVMTECSHLNNTEFIEKRNNTTFYRLGTIDPEFGNITLITFESWKFELQKGYKVINFSYDNNTNVGFWRPPEFLLKQLASPFAMDNISSPSAVTIIFNSLASVSAYYANADPFFLTETTKNEAGFYSAGQEIATLICRDRIQLKVDSGTSSPSFLSTGTVSDVSKIWSSYRAMQPNSTEVIDLDSDYGLLMSHLYPSIIWKSLSGLHGSLLDAQRWLQFPGVQIELPENVTARREHLRWFGVILLDVLYMANTLTGTDNNMGLGVNQFSDNVWFCDNTLRYTSIYASIKLWDLFIIGLLVGGITALSYTLPELLYYFIKTVKGQEDKWWRLIGAPLISFTLHDVMHLYRIATGQDFIGTLSTMPVYNGSNKRDGGKAPYYGIVAWKYHRLLRGDKDPPLAREDVELQDIDNHATNDDASQNRSETSLNQGDDRTTNAVSQNRSENLESNEDRNSATPDDTVSSNRSRNSQFSDEGSQGVEDSVTIAMAAQRTDAGTDESANSDLESDDVDDEVDVSSQHRPYIATMHRDPVSRDRKEIDEVQ